MNQDLVDYYNERFEMFSSKGWKDLIQDLEKMKEVTGDVNACMDETSFWKAKGELRLINWFLNLEQLSEAAFTQLKEQDASDV
jgi:hypothetical protein